MLINNRISRATLGRIPAYLKFIKSLPPETENVSSAVIAKNLGLGDVQVRKDLSMLCKTGRPKIGYKRDELTNSLQDFLDCRNGEAVIIGAGRLGSALLCYDGFFEYGLNILAAFDNHVSDVIGSEIKKPILPMKDFSSFCKEHKPKIGIIAVPAEAAQESCNLCYENGIKTMWCFAPCQLYKPEDAVIQYENLALSLAYLKTAIR